MPKGSQIESLFVVSEKRRCEMFRLKKFFAVHKLRRTKLNVRFNEKIWDAERPFIERQNAIDEEKNEVLGRKKELHFPSWGKILLIFLFINFTILEIFIGWVTIKSFALALAIGVMPDFTPLITLIGAVIGETISYGIYSAKSKAENTEGGVVFEKAKWEYERQLQEDETGSVG